MDEIKYRAWDKETKKMHDVYTLVLNEDGTVRWVYYWDDDPMLKHEDVELLEFTGLKDRNGVEIYEGHILQVKNELDHINGVVGKVTQGDGQFSWDSNHFNRMFRVSTGLIMALNLEVIGNRFENPELLKEE